MKKKSQNPGISLLIAIVYVSAFMLVMAGLYTATSRVLQSIGNREQEAKADYLAQSAFELASYWAATHGEGQNLSDLNAGQRDALFAPLYQAAADLGIVAVASDCQNSKCVGFDVIGRSDQNDVTKKVDFTPTGGGLQQVYSVPVRATGNAEPKCADGVGGGKDSEDGCNWNKLYVGQRADIPLYYVDANGARQVLTGDFKLRVRTPKCSVFGFAGANCDNNANGPRVVLYPQATASLKLSNFGSYPFRNVDTDPVLIQWTIDDSINSNFISAFDHTDTYQSKNFRSISPSVQQSNTNNTEISAGLINDSNPNDAPDPAVYINDFVVLSPSLSGKDIDKNASLINTYLTNSLNTGGKPVLHLSLIDQPRIDDDNQSITSMPSQGHPSALNDPQYNVSYLEYQLLTSQAPITDTKSYLYSWAEFGGFKKEIKRELNRSVTGGGFALENF